ncbi:MAG: hypothetical protein JXR07_12975 [Reichenbachiella sp.]
MEKIIFNKKIIKKVSYAHLFLSLLLSLTHYNLTALSKPLDKEPALYSAYSDILKLKLESGREKLHRIIPTQSQLGHYHYISSLADVFEVLVTEDESVYKKFEDSEEDHLKGLKDLEDGDAHKLYYSAEIKIHWAVAKMLFDDEVKAGWSLKSAYGDIEENIKDFPDFSANYKSYGTLHVLFAVVPDSYHWLLRLFGVKANSIQGWEELNLVEKANPYWIETGLTKAMIAINIINNEEKSMKILDDLLSAQKDNLIINYLYHNALIKYARSEEALEGLKKLTYTSRSYFPIFNIYYKIGEIYIQKQNYALARLYYSRFLNMHEGTNYIKDTWFKIFLTFWLEGNDKMAEIHWLKAKKTGRAFVSADTNAEDILSRDHYPNKTLIKARLAIDGGYFNLANQALGGIKQGFLTNKKEECEYFYRYARLYDKEDKQEDAIFYYLNTIKKANRENWYYAPTASLYIGYIYEESLEYEKAQYFYEKALSYKKHKYKAGIDNKALAALELLKEKYPLEEE